MTKDNIQILSTASAMKGASTEDTVAPDGKLYPTGYANDESQLNEVSFKIYLPLLKEQITTNTKVKEQNLLASQFRKLLFSDTEVVKFVDGKIVGTEWLDSKLEGLYKNCKDTLQEISTAQEAFLLEDLGIEKNDSGYTIVNSETLIEAIQSELTDRDPQKNEDTIKFLERLKSNNEANFDFSGATQELSNFISGMVTKSLTRIKLPGNSLILKSSWGVDNDLKFYDLIDGMVTKAEAKIAMQGNFKIVINRKEVQDLAKRTYGSKPTKEQLRISLN